MLLILIYIINCYAIEYQVISNISGIEKYYKINTCLHDDFINEYWFRYEIYNDTHYITRYSINENRCKSRIYDYENYGILNIKNDISIKDYAFCIIYYYDSLCTEYLELPINCYKENICISDPNGGSFYFTKNNDNLTVKNTKYSDNKCKNIIDDNIIITEGCEYIMSPINGYIQYIISNNTNSMAILHISIILLILFFLNY